MSSETLDRLAQRLSEDSSLKSQLENAGSTEERRQIASDAGIELTDADIATLKGGSGELSDSDLDNVSGAGDIGVFGSAVCFSW